MPAPQKSGLVCYYSFASWPTKQASNCRREGSLPSRHTLFSMSLSCYVLAGPPPFLSAEDLEVKLAGDGSMFQGRERAHLPAAVVPSSLHVRDLGIHWLFRRPSKHLVGWVPLIKDFINTKAAWNRILRP